jgi:hypothetical protein
MPEDTMGLGQWVYTLVELNKIQRPSKKVRATITLIEGFIHDLVASFEIVDATADED